jgi:hypothetical protein
MGNIVFIIDIATVSFLQIIFYYNQIDCWQHTTNLVYKGGIDMNNRRRLISKLRRKMLLSERKRIRIKIYERCGSLLKDAYDTWLTGIKLTNNDI